ncbi:hypothetical protein [Leptospira sp. GIMC2001]|uniref:hypothetical protein n=1 Tax=Leptospira sp. GIMC2001 TaxID=1513297 RepID=UPI00234B8581|nr:hypothetical protein [Leptospira sp. GIMC2001]WCL50843.1 hypothetical protein O4O04_08530 [Leptospira sp. GIMC2001]
MKTTITSDPDFPLLIGAYRNNILTKYNFEHIQKYPKFNAIRQEKVETLVRFFLELLYPELNERLRLDKAFDSLKGFVHSPAKVFGLIGSLGISLWKIGRYLPQAFRAGIAALSSYLTVHEFEKILLEGAKEFIAKNEDLYLENNFKKLLSRIPKADADEFRKDTVSLFRTLSNDELVGRIILIMENILAKMTSRSDLYTESEKDGIALGLSILVQGRDILGSLESHEKELMLDAIETIEREYFESCLVF